MTINKVQGQSLKMAEVELSKDCSFMNRFMWSIQE